MNNPENGNLKAASHFANPIVFGGVAIALAIGAFAAWASWAPLNGAIVGFGLVKAETSRKAVQHAEGGIIKTIHVRDGDSVRAGQPLLELDSISTDSNHQLLQELTVFEMIKRDRLDAEQQLLPGFRLDAAISRQFGSRLVNAAYAREHKIFQVRRHSLDQQIAMLHEQLNAIDHEEKALRGEVAADHKAIDLVQEELGINRSLYQEKFVAKTRVIGMERALTDYQARLGEHDAALAQSIQRRNDIKLRVAATRNEYQRAAAEEFKESSARLVELRERLRPAEDALQRKVITAPASGRVVNLRVHAPGEVAGPRDVLMEIVPDKEGLIIEAQVPVDGIKDLHVDQVADIRFTAFNSRSTPIVTGRVTYVSADALADKNGIPFYMVHIRPDRESMRQATTKALQPGMAAEVFILTEGRTTLDYLLSPVTDAMRRSLREK